jgi:hypothetical protein
MEYLAKETSDTAQHALRYRRLGGEMMRYLEYNSTTKLSLMSGRIS